MPRWTSKHVLARAEGDEHLPLHLGLIGHFSVVPAPCGAPVGAVRVRLAGSRAVADLRGATVCELASPERVDAVMARLGPDPLRADADPERGWARLHASGRPVAELLMDQSVLAGVGNVYRCELLFRHRVDPYRPGREIRPATWRALWSDLVALLPLGVRYGQILTMADQVEQAQASYDDPATRALELAHTDNRPATTFERRFHVYQRTGEPCHTCGSKVRAAQLAGRTLYWCGRCQRRR